MMREEEKGEEQMLLRFARLPNEKYLNRVVSYIAHHF
jgi:hypothetical protein